MKRSLLTSRWLFLLGGIVIGVATGMALSRLELSSGMVQNLASEGVGFALGAIATYTILDVFIARRQEQHWYQTKLSVFEHLLLQLLPLVSITSSDQDNNRMPITDEQWLQTRCWLVTQMTRALLPISFQLALSQPELVTPQHYLPLLSNLQRVLLLHDMYVTDTGQPNDRILNEAITDYFETIHTSGQALVAQIQADFPECAGLNEFSTNSLTRFIITGPYVDLAFRQLGIDLGKWSWAEHQFPK